MKNPLPRTVSIVLGGSAVIGAVLAGLGGLFMGQLQWASVDLEHIGMLVLPAVVIGGMQSIPGAVIGGPPQDISYKGEPTQLIIGSNNVFREFSTVNIATSKADG